MRGHALKNEVGNKYGRLTVLSRAGTGSLRQALWLCRCECANEKVVAGEALRSGRIVSCGCFHREATIRAHTRHGHAVNGSKRSEYGIWIAMKNRCLEPSNQAYRHYGGRGITVCERWQADYANFYADMGPRPSLNHSIERMNNDGNYEPGNCVWATKKTQGRNKRANVPVIRSDGRTYGTIVEAAEDVGVHPTGISAVLRGKQSTAGGYSWKPALLKALIATDAAAPIKPSEKEG